MRSRKYAVLLGGEKPTIVLADTGSLFAYHNDFHRSLENKQFKPKLGHTVCRVTVLPTLYVDSGSAPVGRSPLRFVCNYQLAC